MQTFLFTDIEGSTRLWERHPQAMGAAVARHERILREAIGVRGGTVFNTAGDSVCAVFPTTDRAVAAAIDAQRQLLAEPWDTYAPELKIAVRMALDAGDAEASGENFVGPVLNRLHRLMKTGHGGQILCTAAIAPGDLGPDLRLRDLGRHPLRDIAEETQLYQLVAPGLPVVFPPLISERPLLRRLPLPPVALFGRGQQIEEIDTLLRQRQTRIVTLLGPGGVGKTSLALALGRQFVDTVADGVAFVDLSAVRDDALVVPTIAGMLEIDDPLLSPDDALISRLQATSMLLILDNCEQVIDAVAAIVQRLTTETESVTVLATSRLPLRIRGEHEVRIEPLPTPQPSDDPAANPAVQLFTEHARQVSSRFTLNATTELPVVEICRLVDGLPLAIELAAAWVRVLDPGTLHARLAEGAPLLKSNLRDRPERHRTLTSTIDWSYQLLSPDAQWAFGRLSVFQGGIPFDAALAVLQDGERHSFVDALTLIDTLVQANLLQSPIQTDDGPRYGMLQTIQEFGLSRLAADDQLASQRTHAAHFATMAAAAEAYDRGPQTAIWFDRLDANLDNVRAAVTWLATSGAEHSIDGLQMVVQLWEFLEDRNRFQDAQAMLALTLDSAPDAPSRLRARALAQLGNTWLTNYEQAETCFRRSIEAAAADPDGTWQMTATLGLGNIALMRGNFDESLAIARDVLDRARLERDPAAIAQALLVLGYTLEFAGDAAGALEPLQESDRLSQQIEDMGGSAWAHRIEAKAQVAIGDPDRAQALFQHAISEFEAIGDQVMSSACQLDVLHLQLSRNAPTELGALARLLDQLIPIANTFLAIDILATGVQALLAMRRISDARLLLAALEHWEQTTGTVFPSQLRQEMDTAKASIDKAIATPHDIHGRSLSLREALQHLQDVLIQGGKGALVMDESATCCLTPAASYLP